MSTGLEYFDAANAVDSFAAQKYGYYEEDDSNARLCDGLYRAGSLIAFGDGCAKEVDIKEFTVLGWNKSGLLESAWVYLPTNSFIEDQLRYTYYGNGEADFLVQLDTILGGKWSHSFRTVEDDWVTISLFVNMQSKSLIGELEMLRTLGDLAAYHQSRYMNVLTLNGVDKHRIGTLYQHYWHQMATAKPKDRPSVCRNCGRLMPRGNEKGNTQKSCCSDCTTQYNNELKRLRRQYHKDEYSPNNLEHAIELAAWRHNEQRPLAFPGRPLSKMTEADTKQK